VVTPSGCTQPTTESRTTTMRMTRTPVTTRQHGTDTCQGPQDMDEGLLSVWVRGAPLRSGSEDGGELPSVLWANRVAHRLYRDLRDSRGVPASSLDFSYVGELVALPQW